MPSSARSLRAGPSGKKGCRLPRRWCTLASLSCAYWGIGLLALRQGDLSSALPLLERAMGICQDADLPANFPLDRCRPWGRRTPLGGRVADAVPLLTQAMEQTHCNGNELIGDVLSSPPGGGASAGWPSGGGTDPGRASAGAGSCSPRNAVTRPMPCASSARSPQAPQPAGGRAGRRPLPPGPRSGRGTRHAPVTGALSP